MARRFELPRDRLNELKELAQNDAPAAFRKLQSVLEEFGISQELLKAQADTTAVTYDKLSGAAADAFAAMGKNIAQVLEGPAIQLTAWLKETAEGINNLNKAGAKKLAVEEQMLSASQTADQFNQHVVAANKAINDSMRVTNEELTDINPLVGIQNAIRGLVSESTRASLQLNAMTESQFQFAKSATATGISMQTVLDTIKSINPSIQDLELRFNSVGEASGFTRTQLDAFQQAMLAASSASADGSTIAHDLANAVLSGGIKIDEATNKLISYSLGIAESNILQQAAADGANTTATAVQALNTELAENAIKAADAAVSTAQLKDLQAQLANIAGAVAGGHISAGQAALDMAAKYNIAVDAAARLISMQLQLAGLGANGIPTTARRRGQEGGLLGGDSARPGKDNVEAAKANIKFLEQQKRLSEQNRQAELALARAKGDTAGQVNLLRAAQKGLNKESAEFKNIEAQILSLEKQGSKGKGGAGAKSPKLTANEKLNNQLLTQQDKFDNQMEDLEEKHQAKLLDIINDFYKKQLEVQQENEKLKRRSRFDFYSDLNQSQLSPIDREAFAKAYEAAFAKAQEIAQSGRAKLGQEFLALKQQHIEELKELAEEEAEIRADKDLSRGDKEARLRELEGRRKLLEDAQREEEKQLLEGGDKVHNELKERIDEENAAYQEQADKIITAADRAGEAKVRNAERNKIKVDEENKALADQLILYNQIAAKNGGTVPTSALPPTTPLPVTTTPAPITAPEAIPITTTTPLPVQAPDFLTVKQFELFVVRDQGTIDAIGDQTLRLESKLDSLLQQAIESANTLGGKLDQIRSAVLTKSTPRVQP